MLAKITPQLIIALIKDDLINSKLVYSLSQIGLHSTDYQLHLSNTILQLMGFKNDQYGEQVFNLYLELSRKTMQINIVKSSGAFDDLAFEIFQVLYKKIPHTLVEKQSL